jgi:acyl carrier protein
MPGKISGQQKKEYAMSSIEEKVREIVMDKLNVTKEQVTDAASFVDDLGADSLDQAELVLALEDEFNLQISDKDSENLKTVGSAIAYIKEHAKQ